MTKYRRMLRSSNLLKMWVKLVSGVSLLIAEGKDPSFSRGREREMTLETRLYSGLLSSKNSYDRLASMPP